MSEYLFWSELALLVTFAALTLGTAVLAYSVIGLLRYAADRVRAAAALVDEDTLQAVADGESRGHQ